MTYKSVAPYGDEAEEQRRIELKKFPKEWEKYYGRINNRKIETLKDKLWGMVDSDRIGARQLYAMLHEDTKRKMTEKYPQIVRALCVCC